MSGTAIDRAELSEPFDGGFVRTLETMLRRLPAHGRRVDETERRARHRRLHAAGTDFAGHRHYQTGDDLRRVDWNVYARSRELHVTQREHDEHRGLTVLLDTSASMLAGEHRPRWRAAYRLTALVAGLGIRRLDHVHLQVAAGPQHARTFSAGSLREMLTWLADRPGTADRDAPAALVDAVTAGRQRGGGNIVWISDFAPPERFEQPLRRLRAACRGGRRVVALLPGMPEDRTPSVGGYVELVCPETAEHVRVRVDRRLRAAVDRELERLRRSQATMFRSVGVRFARAQVPWDELGQGSANRWRPEEWLSWI